MDRKISIARENGAATMEGVFLTYTTNQKNELTVTGSAEGLKLLAAKLLAAAEGGDVAPLAFTWEPPVSAAYRKMKQAEVERFIASLPRMQPGRSYVLTYTKDGKTKDLVVTCNVPSQSYSVIFEDHFVKYFLRFDGKSYHYVLRKSPSKERDISYAGTIEAVRFFLANEGDGTRGLSWEPRAAELGA